MSQLPNSSVSGADRIRSLKDDDAIFRAFDSYPWTKDKTFMSGLRAILGDPNSSSPKGSPTDMAIHARIFYYAQRIGVSIEFAAYKSWLAQQQNYQPPQILPNDYSSPGPSSQDKSDLPPLTTDATQLSWQQAAPKADLWVDRSREQGDAKSDGGEPAYPMAFAEMIKLLQEGKPVPGIKQIPNTIVRDPSVRPVGTRVAPKKPWEKKADPTAESYSIGALDNDFPPVDSDAALATAGEL